VISPFLICKLPQKLGHLKNQMLHFMGKQMKKSRLIDLNLWNSQAGDLQIHFEHEPRARDQIIQFLSGKSK
jgi:hypothetical protein